LESRAVERGQERRIVTGLAQHEGARLRVRSERNAPSEHLLVLELGSGRRELGVMDRLATPVVEAAAVVAQHAARVAMGEVLSLFGREIAAGAGVLVEDEGHAVAAAVIGARSVLREIAGCLRPKIALELGERHAELVLEQRVEEIVVARTCRAEQPVHGAAPEALLEIGEERKARVVPALVTEEREAAEREEQGVLDGSALERAAVLVERVAAEQRGVELRDPLDEPMRVIAAVERDADQPLRVRRARDA